MTRTMTVSEIMSEYMKPEHDDMSDFLKLVAPITIIADPEPRPDFLSMAPSDLLSWIYQNGDHDETSCTMTYLQVQAGIAARRLGLT